MKRLSWLWLAPLLLGLSVASPAPAEHTTSGTRLVRLGDLDALNAWLEHGSSDPNQADDDGWTPLLAAAARGRADMVALLLKHPGHPSDPGVRFAPSQALAVHLAAQSGDVASVALLLDARPGDLEEKLPVNGHTPLLQAVFYNRTALTKMLLDRGADTAATTLRGLSALALARQFGNSELIGLLETRPPAEEAVAKDYADNLARIREHPASGEEAAQAAVDAAASAIAMALVEAGRQGTPPEELLMRLQQLLDACQVNRLAGDLRQPLLVIAVTGGNAEPHPENARSFRTLLVKSLLARGADPLQKEKHPMGTQSITRAAAFGHVTSLREMAASLEPHRLKAALNEVPAVNGYTTLHDAVVRAGTAADPSGYLETIRWARLHGSRDDLEDFNGLTPRDHAEALADPVRRTLVMEAMGSPGGQP
ncbi:ankyrin repeat domain-containing protein [Solidesulfovibrio carbinolicus]|uniref:Uncharacterized protein n=1 Tax=Solidesulfovibrio carbinolicus TaxID=296842 RepID=A0A4P6HQ60_9BACT|nr:ankyrin repeat domain-containing protein [Solidesulfovibrio carbinolicus]QAZ68270.1 hypothetical protein C3Y92_13980 [Solidesulfovibrio carbinolicus]